MRWKKKKYLIVINDVPYGDERPYNALRLALNVVKREGVPVTVLLIADGIFCARPGQKTPVNGDCFAAKVQKRRLAMTCQRRPTRG